MWNDDSCRLMAGAPSKLCLGRTLVAVGNEPLLLNAADDLVYNANRALTPGEEIS